MPGSAALHLARALLRAGEEKKAGEALVESRAALPRDGDVAHLQARFLATASDPALRDGPRAFDLAVQIFQASLEPEHGETPAMAFAENDRFDDAVELQRTVVAQLTRTDGAPPLLERARKRLDLYLAKQPCRSRGENSRTSLSSACRGSCRSVSPLHAAGLGSRPFAAGTPCTGRHPWARR